MVDGLIAEVDRLVDLDPSVLADGATIVELDRQFARLEAVKARATAAWDAERGWAADGARSAAAWLAWKRNLPQASARRCVRLGRALRDLPHAEKAWLAGDIGAAHVAALASARTDRTAEVMDRDEEMLVGEATRLRFSHFQRVLAYWHQHADPDGVEDAAARLRDDRRLDASTTFQGSVVGDFVLDPIGGAIVAGELSRLEKQLFDADWAEAKARLGREPNIADLRRTPRQRRADALVEMAARSKTAPEHGRRPAPLFSVFVDYETFAGRICELADGTVVTPGSLIPWLDEAYIRRIVFGGRSRVIDVGEDTRLFTGATRTAVQCRDLLECFHHTCDERAEGAEIDHVVPASAGGPTRQDNGRVACRFHNQQRNRRPDTS